jgi:hypothetical protein
MLDLKKKAKQIIQPLSPSLKEKLYAPEMVFI